MEVRRRVRSEMMVLAVIVIGMLFVGQTTAATFKECYESCFLLCFITPGTSVFSCATKCFKDCILPPPFNSSSSSSFSTLDLETNNSRGKAMSLYFCKLGCATCLCSNISSLHNPRAEKVARCVDSCSSTCTNNN